MRAKASLLLLLTSALAAACSPPAAFETDASTSDADYPALLPAETLRARAQAPRPEGTRRSASAGDAPEPRAAAPAGRAA
ncbi:hypothetical protein, partial [Roseovarius salinarum]|uniref:hypothetical protein n=1 Tax=Roseovarius salinarum TaxID=1981892 RepID=UPI001E329D61